MRFKFYLGILSVSVACLAFATVDFHIERKASAIETGSGSVRGLWTAQLARASDNAQAALRVAIVPERSAARYRVREQLARLEFPNDAVGETKEISGTITFTTDGKVIPSHSRIVVGLTSITSDSERRDSYIRRRTLGTDQFPTAIFVLREILGLSWPPPTQGKVNFQLRGDLMVRDQTRTVLWDATAQFGSTEATGTAKTTVTFNEVKLEKPSVLSVLSVNDDIRLELDFTFVRN